MLRRFRFLTALLALLTLSAYGAEVAAFSAFCYDAGAEQNAAAPQHGVSAETLIRSADAGPNGWVWASPATNEALPAAASVVRARATSSMGRERSAGADRG